MIRWAPYAFVRLTLALAAGILTYLYGGETLPDLRGMFLAAVVLFLAVQLWAGKKLSAGPTNGAGLLALAGVYLAGLVATQQATETRRPGHLSQLPGPVEYYRAVVDDYTVVRPTTYATTVRVSAVRIGGRWRPAHGGIRVSVPREEGGGAVPAPYYGDVWLVRDGPAPAKGPLNPGEFDYRRYLAYHQIYHQQFIHHDQYRRVATRPPSYLTAISLRAAYVIDGIFKQYVHERREYSMASALVLGLKDDIDQDTKQAYAATGTTHIMAVSGLQVGLLFGAVTWLVGLIPGRRGPFFRFGVAVLGIAVVWGYAFLTGLSASVLRATVMFTFIIVARAANRQTNIYNTLAVAAFVLLCYDPYLLADVGFQLSFLAVLSIVYLQPRIGRLLDVHDYFLARQRPWQPKGVRQLWRVAGWSADWLWQATALSLAAQVATFPLGLFYFHQFPLSFLASNLVAVPISSLAVYVGLGLLLLKGLTTLLALVLPAALGPVLEGVPRTLAWVFEKMIWAFNEYIFWIGRALPGALISGIHVTAPQTWLIFGVILALLTFLAVRRLPWLGVACALLGLFAGSRVYAARRLAPDARLIVYSIPRRSVCGFWQGAATDIVSVDTLALSETERTYRIVPGLIAREARWVRYHQGWRTAPVPAALAAPDSGLVLTVWRGLRVAFVSQKLRPARLPCPVDVVILRRNARVRAADVLAVFGEKAQIVLDSSCRPWYVRQLAPELQGLGLQVHDVTGQGAFSLALRPRPAGL